MNRPGATVQSSVTYRHGPNLNRKAGLNLLEEPQETNNRLTLGANSEQGDQRTATTLDELTFEATYTARPDTRPHDQIGSAFGRSITTSTP